MFELESKRPEEITIITKQAKITFDTVEFTIDAELNVGKIKGAGEFEIGDVAIRAIATESGKVIYDAEVGGAHIGIIGGCEEGLDDLGVADILCTSSVRAVREIEPKLVIAMGNIDGMVTELKLTARTEKKLKVKNADALPAALEVVALS
ncbi:hypothetical protein IJI91_03835 [Candidatus Saccharibacteria bacterium]|nr:hypothetical protein [Candidatus Saccharibacteria bacterium]